MVTVDAVVEIDNDKDGHSMVGSCTNDTKDRNTDCDCEEDDMKKLDTTSISSAAAGRLDAQQHNQSDNNICGMSSIHNNNNGGKLKAIGNREHTSSNSSISMIGDDVELKQLNNKTNNRVSFKIFTT